MATPILTGQVYDFFITTVIFIFLFAILYGLLSKMELFGTNKAVHVLIAFSTSLLVVFIPETKELINFMTPWFVILVLLILFILLAVMSLGIKHSEITDYLKNSSPGTTTTVVIIVIILFFCAVYKVFGPVLTIAGPEKTGLWAVISRVLFQPKVLGVLFLLLVASAVIRTIGYKET